MEKNIVLENSVIPEKDVIFFSSIDAQKSCCCIACFKGSGGTVFL